MLFKCNNCDKDVTRTKGQYNKSKSKKFYCSRSCSQTKNNEGKCRNPKKERVCKSCSGIFFKNWKHRSVSYCPDCIGTSSFVELATEAIKARTIGEERAKLSVSGKHPSWLHSNIRNLNRSWNKSMTKLPCGNPICDYSVHVELAHKKDIASFPDSTTLGEVNHPDNVVQLCRNCHWEFDHGILVLHCPHGESNSD